MNATKLVKYAPVGLFAVVAMGLSQGCATVAADPHATTSEVRKTDAFHGIDLAGTLEVEARIDSATRVEVIGAPGRLAQVLTSVKDGILVIETRGKLDKSKLRVVVTAPSLDTLSITGTGQLRASGLTGSAVRATVAGTGQLQLAGKTTSLRLDVPGTGEIRAKDLVAEAATVSIDGTGEVKLHASRSLDVAISGTGALRVHGRPSQVKKTITGTGVVDMH